jgi:hypothetical protein
MIPLKGIEICVYNTVLFTVFQHILHDETHHWEHILYLNIYFMMKHYFKNGVLFCDIKQHRKRSVS